MTALDTKLLPCPFCGGSPDLCDTLPVGSLWYRCEECGGETDGGKTEADAIARWNRRVSPSQGEGPAADVVERTSNPGERREIQFHLDRLNAWLTELWAANNLTLHMCNGTVRTGLHGLLCDIRDDVMAVRDALASLAQRAVQEAPADEQSGETSHVAVSYAMVEAARNAFRKRGWGYRDEDIRAAITAALGAEPGEAVACPRCEGTGSMESELRGFEHCTVCDGTGKVNAALAHPLPLKEEVERVLEKMAEGWANVLELDLIPRQHRMSASILRDDARTLLSRIRAGAQEGWRPEDLIPGRVAAPPPEAKGGRS